jgi:recombination protein RecR
MNIKVANKVSLFAHMFPSKTIESAVKELSKFPGIGKKTATRLALFLLKSEQESVERLAGSLVDLKTLTKFCVTCGNISESDSCRICSSLNRNKQVLCIVKDFQDIIALESTGQYNGIYHVLGGLISPLEGIGPGDIAIGNLMDRIDLGEITEIVMALNATMEGDTTAFYISKLLKDSDVRVSAISRGISVGGELEYADEITLGRSIMNRVPYLDQNSSTGS